MDWVEIQLRVAVDRIEESNTLVATIGDAVAEVTASTGTDRPWFMTSELVGGDVAANLADLLRRRAVPLSAAESVRGPNGPAPVGRIQALADNAGSDAPVVAASSG